MPENLSLFTSTEQKTIQIGSHVSYGNSVQWFTPSGRNLQRYILIPWYLPVKRPLVRAKAEVYSP